MIDGEKEREAKHRGRESRRGKTEWEGGRDDGGRRGEAEKMADW